jgi:hypothetical protein
MNGKPSSPVLRGLGASNGARPLDSNVDCEVVPEVNIRMRRCHLPRDFPLPKLGLKSATATSVALQPLAASYMLVLGGNLALGRAPFRT